MRLLIVSGCVLLACSGNYVWGDEMSERDKLQAAAMFYASFDEAAQGDFGEGIKQFSTRFNHESKAGEFVFEKGFDDKVFRIAPQKGIHGGALEVVDVLPRNGRIYFPAHQNIAFKPGGWSGAASMWLNTNPNELLKTTFCDPLQMTQFGAHNGGLWVDFNNAKPRDMRMGAFTSLAVGQKPTPENDPQAPLIQLPAVPLKSGEWHHVVLNWQNFDTGKPDAQAELYLDGKRIGQLQNRTISMNWDTQKAGLYVAVNYIGLLDEFSIFRRSLTAAEINRLYQEPGLLAPLKKQP